MKKVVLANLPWKIDDRWGVRAGSRWPHIKDDTERDYLCYPFFLAYATALLRKNGIDAVLIDAIASEILYDKFVAKIEKEVPDILVVETSTVSLEHDLRLIDRLNKDIKVVLCGLDYSITKPLFLQLNPRIDYVMVGEYEFTLLHLVQVLTSGKDLSEVLGILYRDKKGDVRVNPLRPLGNLDELPWPVRDELPMIKYTDAPGGMPLPNAQMMASRGCPFPCIFCAWPQLMYHSNHYRSRSVVDVANEMQYLVNNMGFKSLYFDDDTFNVGRDRMLALAHEIRIRNEENALNVPWAIMARADLMDEEVLVNLADAGLHTVKYGIESADQTLLNNANKRMDIKKAEDMVKFTKSLGIKVHLTFTFGLPGETKDTVKKTIDFALALDPISLQFSITTPYPGTTFHKHLVKEDMLVSENVSDYDGNHKSVICTEHMTAEELEEAKDRAWYIWGEHCEAKRGYRRVQLNKDYVKRVLQYLNQYGVRYTFKKSVDFMLFIIKNSLFLKMIKKYSISNDEIALVFDRGSLCLFWDDMLLTKDVGMNASIKSRDKWYDSSRAKWKIVEKKRNFIVIKSIWDFLPVEQIWHVVIGKENIIHVNVEMKVKREFHIDERKFGILVSEQYVKWSNSLQEGYFPKICDWQDMDLEDENTGIISVFDQRAVTGKFPSIKLSFENEKDATTQIQNTSREINGRMIQAQYPESKTFKKGTYNFFSGKIFLEE